MQRLLNTQKPLVWLLRTAYRPSSSATAMSRLTIAIFLRPAEPRIGDSDAASDAREIAVESHPLQRRNYQPSEEPFPPTR